MVFPVGDDNTDRRTFPFVTIALLIANVFVFVVLQGMGSNEAFTMAYVQVPAEIISGRDIVTEPSVRTMHTPQGDFQVPDPGLRPTPIPRGSPSSRRSSCTAASCTSPATCGFSGSSATTSKTTWAT